MEKKKRIPYDDVGRLIIIHRNQEQCRKTEISNKNIQKFAMVFRNHEQ